MRLDEYLSEKKLTQGAFAALLTPRVAQSLVSQWVRGVTRVTLDQAIQIESLTEGRVTPRELAEMFGSREHEAA